MEDLEHVKGLADLQRFMDQLTPKMERNVVTGGLRAGMKVIRDEAKRNIDSDSGLLAASLDHGKAISVNTRSGVVTAKLRAGTGFGQSGAPPANLPVWVEYGTRAHWIRVKEEARPNRLTRRGFRTFSLRTLNRMAARGSLVVGGNFIGESVAHPGATKHPFMRPALDSQARAAVVAMGEYIRDRLATKHGLDTADIEIGGDDE